MTRVTFFSEITGKNLKVMWTQYIALKGSQFVTWTCYMFSPGHYFLICKMNNDCLFNIHFSLSSFQKEPQFYSVDHPTPHDSGKGVIPSSKGGQDPSIPLTVIPHLWHVAQPRNESTFAGKHLGKGNFLLEKKAKKVMVSQLPLNTGDLAIGSHLTDSRNRKPTLGGNQIQIRELQGHCHTTPAV